MAPLDILIVGCGIAGPTLASFLLLNSHQPADEKPHITILERGSTMRPRGQNVDIRGTGVTVIRKLGLEGSVRASSTGEIGVKFVDARNWTWAYSAVDKSGKVPGGTSDIEILRGELARVCFERCREVSERVKKDGGAGVEFVFGDYLEEVEQDDESSPAADKAGAKVRVKLAKSGERRQFDLLVGADGLQSLTRKVVWGDEGEEARLHRLDMYGGFFSMPAGETDDDWRRWFHAPGRRGVMLRPSGQKDRTTVFMTVVNKDDRRLRDVATDGYKAVEAQKALLREYFRDAGWECERILKGMDATDDFYYDLVAQVKMDKWSRGRVVLLGDAAYCASPISGMGSTLALIGAYHLAGALSTLDQPTNDSIQYTAALVQYESAMRPIVTRAQKLAPGAPKTFSPETWWGIWTLRLIAGFITWSGLSTLLFRFAGPPATEVTVEEYGFEVLNEGKL